MKRTHMFSMYTACRSLSRSDAVAPSDAAHMVWGLGFTQPYIPAVSPPLSRCDRFHCIMVARLLHDSKQLLYGCFNRTLGCGLLQSQPRATRCIFEQNGYLEHSIICQAAGNNAVQEKAPRACSGSGLNPEDVATKHWKSPDAVTGKPSWVSQTM